MRFAELVCFDCDGYALHIPCLSTADRDPPAAYRTYLDRSCLFINSPNRSPTYSFVMTNLYGSLLPLSLAVCACAVIRNTARCHD